MNELIELIKWMDDELLIYMYIQPIRLEKPSIHLSVKKA
jgi:hypothetical protein